MKTGFISIIALASVAACAAPTSSSQEALGETAQATSTGGITASISTVLSGTQYTSTVTVKNTGTAPAYNWQVALNLNQSTMAQNNNGLSGASAYAIGTAEVFTPWGGSTVLNAGAQVTFSFLGVKTGSNYAPTISTVDGVANGTAGAVADHVDHTSRAAATVALEVALAYEANKGKNTSPADPMYASYDGLIWASQSYVVSGNEIAFDSNVPGYPFIPTQAKAELAFAQQDPSVAAYLVAGLTSCFIDTSSQWIYNFNPIPLAGYTFSTKAVSKNISTDAWGDPGVDLYTIQGGTANGSETISLNESQVSGKDMEFGILTSVLWSTFSNTGAASSKFHGSSSLPCSPFNGPGGVANPYLVMSLNGSTVTARQTVAGLQCQNLNCTSSLVVDPVPYATAGAYYNTTGLVGPQPNPFTLDPSSLFGTPDHSAQYALNPYAQYGTFTTPVTLMGVTRYKFNLCGSTGSGC